MSDRRRSCPWWLNSRPSFKVDRNLIQTNAYMELSDRALRLYLLVCFLMNRTRREHCEVRLHDLASNLDWTTDQSIEAAEQIKASGLMQVSVYSNQLEFRI
jgi:hypothetical protein